jgi:hypothetical protein
VLAEAPIWGEAFFAVDLDLTELPGPYGGTPGSYNGWPGYINSEDGAQGLFSKWWQAGIALMKPMPIEFNYTHPLI